MIYIQNDQNALFVFESSRLALFCNLKGAVWLRNFSDFKQASEIILKFFAVNYTSYVYVTLDFFLKRKKYKERNMRSNVYLQQGRVKKSD